MADVLSKGTLFPEELVTEMINNVKGRSSLAALCASTPIPFNGQKEFTFTLDREIDVVAENGKKSKGGGTIAPRTIVPIKVEYGMRVSDEFVYATEKVKLDYLRAFSEGFAKKVAKGIDLMAFHGINPRTGTASDVIGANHFDSKVTQTVTFDGTGTPDDAIEAAIALVQGSENDVTGMAIAPAFRSALAAQTAQDGRKLYPELAWGSNPGTINGLKVDVNSTVSANSSLDRAIVGNFADCFRWGYAKEIPIEVIKYGNPDNDEELGDLKGHNQVYLRGEAYIGWGILDPTAFALIKATEAAAAEVSEDTE